MTMINDGDMGGAGDRDGVGGDKDGGGGRRTGRPLGAYNLEVVTPKALVYAGLMTSGDARSWYMIRGDVKSWVCLIKVNGWFWRLKMCTLGNLGFKTKIVDSLLSACHATLAVLHDALRAIVDMLLVAMLIEDMSLVMSTPAYIDLKTITQADGAQSSRVPISLLDDHYVAVRQAQLVDTNTKLDLE
ncbi:hypothetical protein Tco_0488235 [Tanacetum coccineum]